MSLMAVSLSEAQAAAGCLPDWQNWIAFTMFW
jgi:hypothetical protein